MDANGRPEQSRRETRASSPRARCRAAEAKAERQAIADLPRQFSDDDARLIVGRILLASGLANADAATVEFVMRCHREGVAGRDMMRQPEYFEMLNDEGRREPKWSWFLTVKPANHALVAIRNFNRAIGAGITAFRFLPSNMVAGPCAAAAAFGDRVYNWQDVSPPPFNECAHPDQCACLWRSEMLWDD